MADKQARSLSSGEGDRGSPSGGKPEAKKAKTKDFASGQGLEPKEKEVAHQESPEDISIGAQQDTSEKQARDQFFKR